MIRWKFILTRVAIVVTVFLIVRYAMGPVAKYVTVQSLEKHIGTKVDIDRAVVGLFPPSVRYEGLRVADRGQGKSRPNVIEVGSMDLEIDGDAFLHRRYVVRDGQISGLKVGFDQLAPGYFDPLPSLDTKGSDSTELFNELFESMTEASQKMQATFANDLEMVKRADQIRRRWKAEYSMLTKRAEQLEASIKVIRESAKGVENPLRDWPRVEAALAKSKEVQNELALVRAAIDEIPTKVQTDLISMQDAKQSDVDRIEKVTMLNFPSNDTLGPRLLSDMVNAQVDRLRGYVETGREVANWTVVASKDSQRSGETFELRSDPQLPSVLVRRCDISGVLQSSGQSYALTGVLENLTHQPNLRDQPFFAKLKLEGSQTIRIEYRRDDASTETSESLTVHWPEVPAPKSEISAGDSISLDLKDGRMELWAQLDSKGGQMQGRLVSRRVGTKIEVVNRSNAADSVLVASLKRSLSAVDRVEVDASFAGSWDDMKVSISTNLTQSLKTGVDQAMAAQLTATRSELASELNSTYQAQMADLQTFLTTEQTQARNMVAKADSTIQELSTKILNESGSPDAYLGRLRGNSLK